MESEEKSRPMRTEPLAVRRHLRDFDEQASPDTKPGTRGRGLQGAVSTFYKEETP